VSGVHGAMCAPKCDMMTGDFCPDAPKNTTGLNPLCGLYQGQKTFCGLICDPGHPEGCGTNSTCTAFGSAGVCIFVS
jgi:hypothetical protein